MLMLSSHIFIETGRWRRPHCIPREDRKCITCNTIEDEYHFVIECSIFTDLRKRYISKYYWTNPSMYKLKQLLLHQCFQTQKIKYIFFKSFLIKIQFTKIISVEKDKIYMSILWVLILYHYADKYLCMFFVWCFLHMLTHLLIFSK